LSSVPTHISVVPPVRKTELKLQLIFDSSDFVHVVTSHPCNKYGL